MVSNHVGNYRWTSALEWTGHDAFNSEELRNWTVDGHVAGVTKSAKGLTYATVLGAGHMVRYPINYPNPASDVTEIWFFRFHMINLPRH